MVFCLGWVGFLIRYLFLEKVLVLLVFLCLWFWVVMWLLVFLVMDWLCIWFWLFCFFRWWNVFLVNLVVCRWLLCGDWYWGVKICLWCGWYFVEVLYRFSVMVCDDCWCVGKMIRLVWLGWLLYYGWLFCKCWLGGWWVVFGFWFEVCLFWLWWCLCEFVYDLVVLYIEVDCFVFVLDLWFD